jgi:hypothetical protein
MFSATKSLPGPEAIAIPPTPLAMTLLPGKPTLAISCSDMVVTFWDATDDFAFVKQMTTVVPHVWQLIRMCGDAGFFIRDVPRVGSGLCWEATERVVLCSREQS